MSDILMKRDRDIASFYYDQPSQELPLQMVHLKNEDISLDLQKCQISRLSDDVSKLNLSCENQARRKKPLKQLHPKVLSKSKENTRPGHTHQQSQIELKEDAATSSSKVRQKNAKSLQIQHLGGSSSGISAVKGNKQKQPFQEATNLQETTNSLSMSKVLSSDETPQTQNQQHYKLTVKKGIADLDQLKPQIIKIDQENLGETQAMSDENHKLNKDLKVANIHKMSEISSQSYLQFNNMKIGIKGNNQQSTGKLNQIFKLLKQGKEKAEKQHEQELQGIISIMEEKLKKKVAYPSKHHKSKSSVNSQRDESENRCGSSRTVSPPQLTGRSSSKSGGTRKRCRVPKTTSSIETSVQKRHSKHSSKNLSKQFDNIANLSCTNQKSNQKSKHPSHISNISEIQQLVDLRNPCSKSICETQVVVPNKSQYSNNKLEDIKRMLLNNSACQSNGAVHQRANSSQSQVGQEKSQFRRKIVRKSDLEYAVKLKVSNKLIELKELVRICNAHCHDCPHFQSIVNGLDPQRRKARSKRGPPQ